MSAASWYLPPSSPLERFPSSPHSIAARFGFGDARGGLDKSFFSFPPLFFRVLIPLRRRILIFPRAECWAPGAPRPISHFCLFSLSKSLFTQGGLPPPSPLSRGTADPKSIGCLLWPKRGTSSCPWRYALPYTFFCVFCAFLATFSRLVASDANIFVPRPPPFRLYPHFLFRFIYWVPTSCLHSPHRQSPVFFPS